MTDRPLPPLAALRAFEAAARHRSFKAAAAELHVTATAISHHVRQLEDRLGQPLFRRQPRPVTLTPAGARLAEGLGTAFALIAERIAELAATPRRLRVTATNAFAARRLIPIIPDWRRSFPDIALDVVGTDEVLDLRSGAADLAIRYARALPAAGIARALCRDRYRIVASPTLVPPERGLLPPADLAAYPLIESLWPERYVDAPMWPLAQSALQAADPAGPPLALQPKLAFREELHVLEAVIAGQGIGICSDVIVGPELASGRLRCVSEITLPGFVFYLTWSPAASRTAAIDAFVGWITAKFPAADNPAAGD